jgi:hypothetical protein
MPTVKEMASRAVATDKKLPVASVTCDRFIELIPFLYLRAQIKRICKDSGYPEEKRQLSRFLERKSNPNRDRKTAIIGDKRPIFIA